MKKIMLFLLVLVTSITLAGCTDSTEEIIAPSYQGITVNGSSPLLDGELVTHYKGKDGEVLVELSFSNPSSVAIKSININGYTYNSSRFLEDSSLTLVRLNVNVGDVLGETIYSVDQFSYVAGESSEDVNVTSNNEFRVYVFKDFPEVERSGYNVDKSSINIDFNVVDVDDIIVQNSLRAVIYDGDELVDEVIMADKDNASVSFTDLKTNKTYTVTVYASFNRDDTVGLVEDEVFYTETYVTLANGLPSAIIENQDVDANDVSIDVDVTDTDGVIVDGGLRVQIYRDNEFIEETVIMTDVTNLVFDDLFNDTEYVIKVLADYNLNDGKGNYTDRELTSYTFKTLPREIPLPEIKNLIVNENDIDFDLTISDEEGIIILDTVIANIYINNELVATSKVFKDDVITSDQYNSHVGIQINNLYANQEFTIEIISDYDLNDGTGVKEDQVIFTDSFSTSENEIPEITSFGVLVEQGKITVALGVKDVNSTLTKPLTAVLYSQDPITLEEVEIQTISFNADTNELVFNYPTKKDVNYYVEVFADYNLRDGNGEFRDISLVRQLTYTAEAKAPVAIISDVLYSTSAIQFNVNLIDADITIQENSSFARIYNGEELIATLPLTIPNQDNLEMMTSILFDNLYSNTMYTIEIVTIYDLDDGTLVLTESNLELFTITTEENQAPTIELAEEQLEKTGLVVDANILDPNNVVDLTSMEARIYHITDLETPVEVISLVDLVSNDITFTGLYSNNEYYVKVFVDYNLRDGQGLQENVEIGSISLKTLEKEAPTVAFGDVTATNRSLTVTIDVINPDAVIDGELFAILYGSLGETTHRIDLLSGVNENVTFENLLSNEQYEVYVFADYNLNDQVNDLTHQLLGSSDRARTAALAGTNISIQDMTTTLESISFYANILDVDGIIESDLQVELFRLDDLETPLSTVALSEGQSDLLEFTGLTSNTEYRVIFSATYNTNEVTGPVSGTLYEFNIETRTKTAPTAGFQDVYITESNISFTSDIYDVYTVLIEGSLYAELWEGENLKVTKLLLTDETTFDLTGFLANKELEIRIIGNYDLGDGTNEHEDELLGAYSFKTVSFSEPNVEISSVVPTQNTVDASIYVTDEDDVITGNLVAILYDKDNQELETIDLIVGSNNISFNVRMNAQEAYTVIVKADYNMRTGEAALVGEELAEHVEYMESKFAPEAAIDTIIPTKDSVSFVVDVYDYHDVITPGTTVVELYLNGVLQATSVPVSGEGTVLVFDTPTLYSNTEYELRVVTNYNTESGIGELVHQVIYKTTFRTLKKELPDINITNANIYLTEQAMVDITITDPDSVIIDNSVVVSIYHRDDMNTPVHTVGLPGLTADDLTFGGLYSNNSYVVIVTIAYNLDDQQGDVANYQLGELDLVTAEKATPEVTLEFVNFEKDSVAMDILVLDGDDVITGDLRVVLFDSEGETTFTAPLSVGLNSNIVFNNTLSNEPYYIYVYGDYNMNDQVQIFNDAELYASGRYTSPAKLEMDVDITNLYSTLDSIVFDAYVTDPDDVYDDNLRAVIYAASDLETPIEEIVLPIGSKVEVEFDNLNSDTDYRIYIYADYNLNTQVGLQTNRKLETISIRTLTKLPPEAIVYNQNISESQAKFDLTLDDAFDVFIEGTMTANLYKDEVLVASKLVFTDTVTFDMREFLSNYEFELCITGEYDLGDGSGATPGEFGCFTFRTLEKAAPTVNVNGEAEITQDSVTLNLAVNDPNGSVSGDVVISIYQQSDLTNALPLETIVIPEIDNEYYTSYHDYIFNQTLTVGELYLITVTLDYNLNDEAGEYEDVVLYEQLVYIDNKLAPEARVTNVEHTQDSVTLTVDILDEYNTILVGTTVVDLLLDGSVVASSAPISGVGTVVEFNGLIANTEYTYRVRTDYDKGSGAGENLNENILVATTNNVITQAKQVLTGTVTLVDQTITSLVVDINIDDIDNVRETGSIDLDVYHVSDLETPVHHFDLVNLSYDDYTINGLDSNNEYVFVLTADYDLDEDENPNIVTDHVLSNTSYITVARQDITAFIDYTSLLETAITMDITVVDDDSTLTGNLRVVLYDSEGATAFTAPLVVGINSNIEFTGLLNDEPYYIHVFADYDLHDTVHTFTDEQLAVSDRLQTEALEPMSGEITSITPDLQSLTFNVSVIDVDDVYEANLRAVLYNSSDLSTPLQTLALTVDETNDLVFNGLDTDTNYTIRIITDYNLNSKTGVQTDRILAQSSEKTLIKVPPTVEGNAVQITESAVEFNVTVNDRFDVYYEGSLTAYLYVDGVLRASKDLTTDLVYFDLSSFLANQDFEVKIFGDYNLDDGTGDHNDELGTVSGTTLSYAIPSADIVSVDVLQRTVDLSVLITDNDGTVNGNLQAELFDSAGVSLGVISLSSGLNNVQFNETLNEREIYTIVISTDYNLRDGDGTVNKNLQEYIRVVDNKLTPEADITNVSHGKDSVTFTVDVYDHDAVIEPGTTIAYLYLEGSLVTQSGALTGLGNVVTFNTLNSNREYQIIVRTDYDNESGIGVITDFQLASYLESTDPLELIEYEVTLDNQTSSSLRFDIVVTDIDTTNVLMEAVLYEGATEIERKTINVGNNANLTYNNLTGLTGYDLIIEYTYNPRDGYGVVADNIEAGEFTTLETLAPTATLSLDAETNSIAVTYSYTDDDNAATNSDLVLYKDGGEVERIDITTGDNQTYTFTSLEHNKSYEVKVEATYDLHDLNGVQTVNIAEEAIDTDSLIAITGETIDKKANTLDVHVDNSDGVVTSSFLVATLYRDGKQVATYIVVYDIPTTIDMFNLLSDYEYQLIITGDVNYGDGVLSGETLYTHTFQTLALDKATASIESGDLWTFGGGNISFNVTVDDDNSADGVASDATWYADVYVNGVLQESINIPENVTTLVTTTAGTYAATDAFTVVVRADVDMNDTVGHTPVTTNITSRTYIDMSE